MIQPRGNNVIIPRHGCKHNEEEADNIIVQQLINILKEFLHGVSIIADDTDVCYFLAKYHFKEQAR